MAQLQTFCTQYTYIFFMSAGSNCVCAAAVHCYAGLETAITTENQCQITVFNIKLLDKNIKRDRMKSLKLQKLAKYPCSAPSLCVGGLFAKESPSFLISACLKGGLNALLVKS